MISPDVEYQFCSTQIRWCSERIAEAFNLYIRLFSAIVAGSIFLSIQPGIQKQTNTEAYALLSNIAVGLAGLVACVIIFENYGSRKKYRERLTELGIPPTKRASVLIEVLMVMSIAATTSLLVAFNPFTLVQAAS